MRHHPFVLLTVLVSGIASCTGSDDAATTSFQAPTSAVATTTPSTDPATTVADATPSTTSELAQSSAAVFSLAHDDLCEWLSPDKIAELVKAQYDWDGTATESASRDSLSGCAWELSGTPDVEGLNIVDIGPASAGPPEEPFLDYGDLTSATSTLGVGVRGHPALSDGVIYSSGGFGYAAFGVPEHGYIEVYLWVPGDEGTEDARFAFADAVIHELGWTP
jgi:hypothetical protein